MGNPADDYYQKEADKFYALQLKKEKGDPKRVALAKQFEEMKEAHYWYYEQRW